MARFGAVVVSLLAWSSARIRLTFAVPLVLAVATLIAVSSLCCLAQTAPNLETGFKEYGSFHGGDIDSISLANGKLQLHIPLLSYPQRGKLHLDFYLKFNNPVYTKSHQCSPFIPNDCWWAISPGTTLWGVGVATDPLDVNAYGSAIYVSQTLSRKRHPDRLSHRALRQLHL